MIYVEQLVPIYMSKVLNTDVIEASLNHTIKGVRGVYNKASYKKQRIDMLQKWSDYIYDLIGSIPLVK